MCSFNDLGTLIFLVGFMARQLGSTLSDFFNFLFQVDQKGQLNVLVQGPDNCIFTTWSLPPNEFQRFLLQGLLLSPQEVNSWPSLIPVLHFLVISFDRDVVLTLFVAAGRI